MAAARHSDRAVPDVHRRRARRTPTSTRAARRSSSRPTASRRARASSSPTTVAEAHAAIDAMLVGNSVGDAGARVVDRGFPRRRGSELHRDGRRRARAGARVVAGSQAPARRRPGARTPAAWARIRPRPSSRRRCTRASCAKSSLRRSNGMAADGIPYTGFLYAGVMIDATGNPQRARIQLPPGRSGNAADHGAPASPISSSCSQHARRRHARPRSRPNGTAARRSASCSRRTAIRSARARATSIDRPRPHHRAMRIRTCKVFHAGTALTKATASSSSGGRVLCVTALGDSVRQAQRAAYAAVDDDPFRRHAVPHRHRPSRARARTGLSRERPGVDGQRSWRHIPTSRRSAPIFTGLQAAHRRSAARRSTARRSGATNGRVRRAAAAIADVLEEGSVLERGGVQSSRTSRRHACRRRRPRAPGNSPAAPGRRWACRWCCIRAIPYAPTVHMNVRMFVARTRGAGDAREPMSGGSAAAWISRRTTASRKTPIHFHRACRDALAPFGADVHPRFKRWCDEYFYLKHRNEPRGIGGIFFDDLSEGGFDRCFAMTRSVGDHFLAAYVPILERRRDRRTASASAISRPTAAAATSNSTSSGTAARCSACSRTAAPKRS